MNDRFFVKAFNAGFAAHANAGDAFDAGATTATSGIYNTRQKSGSRTDSAVSMSLLGPRLTNIEGARLNTLQIMGAAELPHREKFTGISRGRAQPIALPSIFSSAGANRKAALAGGSQPAFFKIIGGASGFHRVDTLFNYLGTREIDPENGQDRYNIDITTQDGKTVRTEQERKDLVDEWADQFGPDSKSRDIHRFAIGIRSGEPLKPTAAREILNDAFEGRRFVFAVRDMGDGDYTITAAVATTKDDRRDMNPSEFSHAIHAALKEAAEQHGDELQFTKREAAGRAFSGIRHQLDRFAEGDFGLAFDQHGVPLEAANLRKEASAWTRDIGQGRRNDVLHTVFSARAGTDPAAFRQAVLDTLDAEFPGYRFAVAAHDDKRHVHIHAVIQSRDTEGRHLFLYKSELERVRTTLAEKARENGIDMVHTRRDDRAAAPSYTKEQAAAAAKHPAARASRAAYERKTADEPTPPRSDAQARRRAQAAAEWREVAQTLKDRPETRDAAERAAAEAQRHDKAGYKFAPAPAVERPRTPEPSPEIEDGPGIENTRQTPEKPKPRVRATMTPHFVADLSRQIAAAKRDYEAAKDDPDIDTVDVNKLYLAHLRLSDPKLMQAAREQDDQLRLAQQPEREQRELRTAAEKERQEARAAILQAMERGAPAAEIDALRANYRAALGPSREAQKGREDEFER